MKTLMLKIKNKMAEESGIGTVEVVLILVVLIALVIVFKDQIMTLINSIFTQINKSVKGVY